jgi:hypothetical protein
MKVQMIKKKSTIKIIKIKNNQYKKVALVIEKKMEAGLLKNLSQRTKNKKT